MTVLSAQSIRKRRLLILPFCEAARFEGLSYGLGPCGYDVRIAQSFTLWPGEFVIASTIEKFNMHLDLVGVVHDKSTWARLGLALQNTVIEPGWRGNLTLELSNHSQLTIKIKAGSPIAQVIFHTLDEPTQQPYEGKYQDQKSEPQPAIFEGS